MILAFVDDETILLERQFRYPKHRHFVELPAGKLEAGRAAARDRASASSSRSAATRRATGGRSRRSIPRIGYSTEVIELYGARGLTHVGHALDEGEHLETFEAKIADALEWVRDGMITDTKTTFGLLWWKQLGRAPGRMSPGLPLPRQSAYRDAWGELNIVRHHS